MTGAMSVTVMNQRSEIERVGRLVEAFGEAHRLPPDLMFKVNLALDEIITNIILHGYEDETDHRIRLSLDLRHDGLTIEVEDDGRPFDPLSVTPPDLDRAVDERGIGGLGLHIVRSIMDGVEYRREGDRNVLVMKKSTVDH